MPPTATTPTLTTTGVYSAAQGPVSGTTASPTAAALPFQMRHHGPSSVLVSPIQLVATCVPPQGAVPMTDGWTTYVPVTTAPGQMMVQTCIPISLQQQQQQHQQQPSPPLQSAMVMGGGPASHLQTIAPSHSANSPLLNPLANSTNMEIVWHGVFDNLFSQFYPNRWILYPVMEIPKGNFRIFNDSAKVRFLCQKCGNAWTSMKGRVVFYFHFDQEQCTGIVFFKLFGQKCQKCMPETFEHAMWYPEEVQKVVMNVYNAVGRAVYGVVEAPVFRERRKGKPRTQHNASLCQACAVNACTEGNFDRALTVA